MEKELKFKKPEEISLKEEATEEKLGEKEDRTIEIDESSQEIKIGEKLPWLKTGKELEESEKYWDQEIPSPYGTLYYRGFQLRDGRIRWRTKDDSVMVVVNSTTGIVEAVVGEKVHEQEQE